MKSNRLKQNTGNNKKKGRKEEKKKNCHMNHSPMNKIPLNAY
jgi:hypothetical protein